MRAELGLPSVRGDDEKGGGMMGGFGGSMGGVGGGGKAKRPIGVKFEIPYFTTSGIQVRYLKIIEPKVSLSAVTQLFLSILTCVRSFNTRLCLGYDTSLRAATLQCGCPMCNNGIDELVSNDMNCYRNGLAVCAEHGDGVSALEAVLASSSKEKMSIAGCSGHRILFLEYEHLTHNGPSHTPNENVSFQPCKKP